MNIKNICIVIIGFVASFSVAASSVSWSVDAAFTPFGGTIETERLVGTFTYDTDSLTLSNIGLSMENFSTGVELFSYSFARPRNGFNIIDFFESDPLNSDLSGESAVAIGFNLSGLLDFSNSTGTFSVSSFITDPNHVVQSSRQQCISSDCTTNTGVFTVATSGSLTGTVVPIPAAAWLFGSGLLTLLGRRSLFSRKLEA